MDLLTTLPNQPPYDWEMKLVNLVVSLPVGIQFIDG
jgi:hypothetical protein